MCFMGKQCCSKNVLSKLGKNIRACVLSSRYQGRMKKLWLDIVATLAYIIPTLAYIVPTLAYIVPTLAYIVPTLAYIVPTCVL